MRRDINRRKHQAGERHLKNIKQVGSEAAQEKENEKTVIG